MKKSVSLVMLGLLLGGCGGQAEQPDDNVSPPASSSSSSSSSTSSSSVSSSSPAASSSSASSVPELATDASGLLQVARSLPLLSAEEYRNTVVSLFGPGLPENIDALLVELAEKEQVESTDHSTEVINQERLQQYFELARLISVSHWAKSSFFGENVKSRHALSDYFIDEFALQAYRRLLQENERAYFEDLLLRDQVPLEALEFALQTVLTSPNFLYHSRLGLAQAEVAESGWGFGADHTMGYVDGFGSVTASGVNFQDPNSPISQVLPDITYSFVNGPLDEGAYLYVDYPVSQYLPLHSLSRVTVVARTSDAEATAGLAIRIGDAEVQTVEPLTTDPQRFSFLVEGFGGSEQIFLASATSDFEAIVDSVSVAPALHLGLAPALNTPVEGSFLLTPFEAAAFIAYENAGTAPDQQLLTKAITGELNKPEVVEAEISRLQAGRDQQNAQGM